MAVFAVIVNASKIQSALYKSFREYHASPPDQKQALLKHRGISLK